jgi:hypothetical protein
VRGAPLPRAGTSFGIGIGCGGGGGGDRVEDSLDLIGRQQGKKACDPSIRKKGRREREEGRRQIPKEFM